MQAKKRKNSFDSPKAKRQKLNSGKPANPSAKVTAPQIPKNPSESRRTDDSNDLNEIVTPQRKAGAPMITVSVPTLTRIETPYEKSHPNVKHSLKVPKQFTLDGNVVKVGRDGSSCQIVLDSSVRCKQISLMISRQHGEFLNKADGWYICDLKSTNGISVNGTKIGRFGPPVKIENGDEILFGNKHEQTEFLYKFEVIPRRQLSSQAINSSGDIPMLADSRITPGRRGTEGRPSNHGNLSSFSSSNASSTEIVMDEAAVAEKVSKLTEQFMQKHTDAIVSQLSKVEDERRREREERNRKEEQKLDRLRLENQQKAQEIEAMKRKLEEEKQRQDEVKRKEEDERRVLEQTIQQQQLEVAKKEKELQREKAKQSELTEKELAAARAKEDAAQKKLRELDAQRLELNEKRNKNAEKVLLDKQRMEAEIAAMKQKQAQYEKESEAKHKKAVENETTIRERFGDEVLCVICQDVMVGAVSAKCGHSTCHKCAVEWIREQMDTAEGATCPNCRSKITNEHELNRAIVIDNLIRDLYIAKMSPDELTEYETRQKEYKTWSAAYDIEKKEKLEAKNKKKPSPVRRSPRRQVVAAAANRAFPIPVSSFAPRIIPNTAVIPPQPGLFRPPAHQLPVPMSSAAARPSQFSFSRIPGMPPQSAMPWGPAMPPSSSSPPVHVPPHAPAPGVVMVHGVAIPVEEMRLQERAFAELRVRNTQARAVPNNSSVPLFRRGAAAAASVAATGVVPGRAMLPPILAPPPPLSVAAAAPSLRAAAPASARRAVVRRGNRRRTEESSSSESSDESSSDSSHNAYASSDSSDSERRTHPNNRCRHRFANGRICAVVGRDYHRGRTPNLRNNAKPIFDGKHFCRKHRR